MTRRVIWIAAAIAVAWVPAVAEDAGQEAHGAQRAPSGMSPGSSSPKINVRYSRPGGGTIELPPNAPRTQASHFSLSPSYNSNFANEPRRQVHQATQTVLNPREDQWYAAWGNGFILGTQRDYAHPHPYPIWFPYGRWEYREVRVWIPPRWVEEQIPPEYRYQLVRGRYVPVMVRPARLVRRHIPGHYETRLQRVWVSHFVGGFYHAGSATRHSSRAYSRGEAQPGREPVVSETRERESQTGYERNSVWRNRTHSVREGR